MHLPPWALAIALVLAIGYTVPYLLLSGNESWSGTFLFWLAFGAAIWAILVRRIARWNVDASPSARVDGTR